MPFKIFYSHKKLKKSKSSKSTTDLAERADEAPGCDTRANSKSILNLFSCNKDSNHVSFKVSFEDKGKKEKKVAGLSEYKKSESLIHIPVAGEDNSHQITENHSGIRHNQNDHIDRSNQPKRSVSCSAFMDSMGRERRLQEIAQLDSYIEYIRHTEDEGNLANRLCCALVLKTSFIRLEQMHQNMLLSQERLEASSNHPDTKNKVSFRHGSQQLSSTRIQVQKQAERDAHSDVDDDLQFVVGSDLESNEKESGHDSSSEQDLSDDNAKRGILKKPKCSSTVKKIPVLPPDIEIF